MAMSVDMLDSVAGIVPAINASIILQLLSTSFPYLKKLQRDEGPQVPYEIM